MQRADHELRHPETVPLARESRTGLLALLDRRQEAGSAGPSPLRDRLARSDPHDPTGRPTEAQRRVSREVGDRRDLLGVPIDKLVGVRRDFLGVPIDMLSGDQQVLPVGPIGKLIVGPQGRSRRGVLIVGPTGSPSAVRTGSAPAGERWPGLPSGCCRKRRPIPVRRQAVPVLRPPDGVRRPAVPVPRPPAQASRERPNARRQLRDCAKQTRRRGPHLGLPGPHDPRGGSCQDGRHPHLVPLQGETTSQHHPPRPGSGRTGGPAGQYRRRSRTSCALSEGAASAPISHLGWHRPLTPTSTTATGRRLRSCAAWSASLPTPRR